jgi:hypothetical protein
VICPGGVFALVSKIGMPAFGLKIPSGYRKPSPAMIEFEMATRITDFPHDPRFDREGSVLQKIAAGADDVAQRFRFDLKLAQSLLQVGLRIIGKARRLTRPWMPCCRRPSAPRACA